RPLIDAELTLCPEGQLLAADGQVPKPLVPLAELHEALAQVERVAHIRAGSAGVEPADATVHRFAKEADVASGTDIGAHLQAVDDERVIVSRVEDDIAPRLDAQPLGDPEGEPSRELAIERPTVGRSLSGK